MTVFAHSPDRLRFGICVSMLTPVLEDAKGFEVITSVAEAGYDYLELPLSRIAALDTSGWRQLRSAIASSGILCEACNDFFPPTLRLTGNVDSSRIGDYLAVALERAAELNVQRIVFGSGRSRNVPGGFEPAQALEQIAALLARIGELAQPLGIVIAVESLRRAECNLLNLHAESLRLVSALGHPAVKMLLDVYHLQEEQEPLSIVHAMNAELCHVHLAAHVGRQFPIFVPEFQALFRQLAAIDYRGRISIEAYSQDMHHDLRSSLDTLKRLQADLH